MSDIVGGILCAGFGSRMRPITDVLPKPLIPFLNTPMITYALHHLVSAGATRVGMNLHHLPDAVPPVCDPLCASLGLTPTYVREWEILGTAGGIRGIWDALGQPDATLVVLNGDSIMNLDLAAHVASHNASGAEATFLVRPRADDQPGRVFLDAAGALQGLRDARAPGAPSELVEHDFIGVHMLEPSFLETLPLANGCMVGDVYIPRLLEGRAPRVDVMDDFWAAIDNPGLYLDTQRRILDDPGLFVQAPLPEPVDPGLFVYRPGAIGENARMAAPVLSGVNVTTEAGVELGPNVCLDGVELAPGAVVRNAALFGMGRLEGEWADCVAIAGKVATPTREKT